MRLFKKLLEKTRKGKMALWTGYFGETDKVVGVVSKHCNLKWVIFRRREERGGKHCLVALNEGDYVLSLGRYGRLYVLSVVRWFEGDFKKGRIFHGTRESLEEELKGFNTGLVGVVGKLIGALEKRRCPCMGVEKFKRVEVEAKKNNRENSYEGEKI